MNRRAAIKRFATAAAGSCLSRFLHGSPKEGDPDAGYTIHSDVRLVLLDVSVKDSHGSTVTGLAKESFAINENGRPQRVTVFDDRDVAVTAGLLVDESRSMAPKRADVLVAAEVFIGESNPQDQIFVLNFNEKVRRGLPEQQLFSDDIRDLRSALARGIPQGKTAFNDAVLAGIDQLELGRREKKTLLVISDGGDNASTHTRHELLEAVERTVATIYTVGLFDAEDEDRNPGLLKQVARISGGEAYFPEDPAGTIPICRKIAKDIRSRYTLGYVPQPESGKSSLRRIQVRVAAAGYAGLRARTRTFYRY